jgi:hypothetical protein
MRGPQIALYQVINAGMDTDTLHLFGTGSYLVNAIGDCSGCHTNRDLPTGSINTASYLLGGQVFDVPPPLWSEGYVRVATANLIGGTNGFFNMTGVQFSTFETLITQGIHAEDPAPERTVSWPMPWDKFAHMTLTDLEAVYTYMNAVATQYGSTLTDREIPDPAMYCDTNVHCPSGYQCSSSTLPGECLHQNCGSATVATDCAICQTCSAASGGVCQTMTGGQLAACEGQGIQ